VSECGGGLMTTMFYNIRFSGRRRRRRRVVKFIGGGSGGIYCIYSGVEAMRVKS